MTGHKGLSAGGVTYFFDKAPLAAYAELQIWIIKITMSDNSTLTAKRVAASTYEDAEKIAEQWLGDVLRRNPGNLLGYTIGQPRGYDC